MEQRLFPCRQNKKPLTKNGFHNATSDIDIQTKWITDNPDCLWGLATGDGFFVLDVDIADGKKGEENLAALESQHGKLPPTKIVRTQSGGRHLYFKYDTDSHTVPCRTNSPAKSLDIRGDGGYVIRENGASYILTSNKPIADAPEWLLQAITPPKRDKSQFDLDKEVISYNESGSLNTILLANGYERISESESQVRYLSPNSSSDSAGTILYKYDQVVYSNHSCKLGDGKLHDAFDCIRILRFDGDWDKAREHVRPRVSVRSNVESADEANIDEYPINLFPDIIKSAILDVHEVIQAPIEICAQSALAYASACAQPHFNVRHPALPKPVPTSMFFLTVAESGERKSSADSMFASPIESHQKKMQEQYRIDLSDWKKDKDGSREPAAQIYSMSNGTMEGMIKTLNRSQPSLAFMSDEAGSFLGGYSMKSEQKVATFAALSTLWDKGMADRVTANDDAVFLADKRVTMHMLAQPSVMRDLLQDSVAKEQGLLARCMTVSPRTMQGYRKSNLFAYDTGIPDGLAAFNRWQTSMLERPSTSDTEYSVNPSTLIMANDARQTWIKFDNILEQKLRVGGHPNKEAINKALMQAVRLSGVFHALTMSRLDVSPISYETSQAAIGVVDWYINSSTYAHEKNAFESQDSKDAKTLLDWIKDKKAKHIYNQLIQRYGPSKLRKDTARRMRAIEELENTDAIKLNPNETEVDGKKRKESWIVT